MKTIARLKPRTRAPERDRPSRWAALSQMVPSLIQSLVMALVGFALTDQLELAIKDRQATVNSIQAMHALLSGIQANEGKEETLQPMVHELALFGVDAIGPLVVLGLNQAVQPHLVTEGLALIAVRYRSQVCEALGSASEMRALFPDAEVQAKFLDRLAVDLECRKKGKPWWRFWDVA